MKTLRTYSAAVSAAVALIAALPMAANAADVYSATGYKDTATAAASPNWTGVYVGVGATGNFINHTLSEPGGSSEFSGVGADGFGGTAFGGVRAQVSRLVFGIEGNFNLSNAETYLHTPGGDGVLALNYTWGAAATGGVLVTPSTLVGGKVGYGGAAFEASGLLIPKAYAKTYSGEGILAGGFVETKFGDGLSFRVGYDYLGLDTQTVKGVADFSTNVHTVSAGLVYSLPVKLPIN